MSSLFKGEYVTVNLEDETIEVILQPHHFYSMSESAALEKELSEANNIIAVDRWAAQSKILDAAAGTFQQMPAVQPSITFCCDAHQT
tara:strand:+ start:77 stop:337 length:261 start_codon:yes stop_codon:yes gene_type:complete